jgi:uncharacterized protein (DUF2235 family)
VGKNVIIFSDGTGQAGGFRFDEDRSNIYKLYRAVRCGPDSSVNPAEQAAFYDPGLGSQADGGHLMGKVARWFYNLVASATGFGITANIVDCYAALIRLWRPGDRIFLFGFSRGAYTVRCLAGVISYCGVPTTGKSGAPLLLDVGGSKRLAAYAVKHIYQFTSSRPRSEANPRQRFLLETRDLLGRRFRSDYGAADGDKANVYPHFIGVFDTVASLGSFRKFALFASVFLLAAAALGLVGAYLSYFPQAPLIGALLARLTFWNVTGGVIALAALGVLVSFVYTHVKLDLRVPGYSLWQSLRTIHFTSIWQKFYDYTLNENVGYARHAISIDENRKDFQRVPWGSTDAKHASRDEHGNLWFAQVWFAGNHSDIGGSYPENEARLSDITLKWMRDSAAAIPGGLKYDPDVLALYPGSHGIQHDEVKAGLGLLTKIFRVSWAKTNRKLPPAEGGGLSTAIMHRSVYERFDGPPVQQYDRMALYRPETLRSHADFADNYSAGARPPATTLSNATAVAAEPISTGKA